MERLPGLERRQRCLRVERKDALYRRVFGHDDGVGARRARCNKVSAPVQARRVSLQGCDSHRVVDLVDVTAFGCGPAEFCNTGFERENR